MLASIIDNENREILVFLRCDRLERPPCGVQGGRDGRAGGYFRQLPDGTSLRLPSKSSGIAFAAGDRFVLETSGGGGLGPPENRDESAIDIDIANGRVSPDGARADYGRS